MDRIAVFLAAVIPSMLVLAYGVVKTRSSWSEEALWNAFLLGAVGAVGALLLELGLVFLIARGSLSPLPNAAAHAFLIAAVPEETIKFVILVGAAEKHVDVRRLQDIVALAVAVSLGFATLENLIYVATPTDWHSIALARTITAVPGHGIDGLAMGAVLTFARLHPDPSRLRLASALFLPVVLHAAYDFPIFAFKGNHTPWLVALWLVILVLSAILAICLCNRALTRAAHADRVSGRDVRPLTTAMPLVASGCAALVVSPLLGILAFRLKEISIVSAGAGLSLLPAALGIDLIWTGIRRRGAKILQPEPSERKQGVEIET